MYCEELKNRGKESTASLELESGLCFLLVSSKTALGLPDSDSRADNSFDSDLVEKVLSYHECFPVQEQLLVFLKSSHVLKFMSSRACGFIFLPKARLIHTGIIWPNPRAAGKSTLKDIICRSAKQCTKYWTWPFLQGLGRVGESTDTPKHKSKGKCSTLSTRTHRDAGVSLGEAAVHLQSPKRRWEGGSGGPDQTEAAWQAGWDLGRVEREKTCPLSLVLVAVFNWASSTSLCCKMKYSFLKPESNNFLQVWLIFTAELPFGTSFPYLPFPDTCGRKHTRTAFFPSWSRTALTVSEPRAPVSQKLNLR